MFLQKEFSDLASYKDDFHKQSDKVSSKGVDWHLYHSLEVIISICKLLRKSDPDQYKRKFNTAWSYVSLRNSIPRGVGKSPKAVIPPELIPLESIQVKFQEANNIVSILQDLPPNSYFKHPYFGMLNLKHAKKFMQMHTEHHLKIVRDIIKAV